MKAFESSSVLARAIAEREYMVEARRAIHCRPELGFEEHATARLIAERLEALGLEVKTGVGGTGVLAVLKGGGPGPTVALRADMDALPVSEETGLPYASVRPGLMHACAHDMHCAVLLGVAAALRECVSEFREQWFSCSSLRRRRTAEHGHSLMRASWLSTSPVLCSGSTCGLILRWAR